MKNLVKTFVVLFLFISQIGLAQISTDVLIGLSSNSAVARGVDNSLVPTIRSKTYPSVLVNVNYALDKHFFVSSGIELTRSGFDILEGTSFDLLGLNVPIGAKVSYSEKIYSIPLHLGFNVPTSFGSVYAKSGVNYAIGGGGNYRLIADSIFDYVVVDDPIPYGDRVNKTELTASLGLGLAWNYGLGQLKIEGNYQHGLTDKLIQENLDLAMRTKKIGVRAGYSVRF